MSLVYSEAAYSQMIADLFGRHQSFQTAGAGAYKPGLQRVEAYDLRHGRPHSKYHCIHVAGTNGKGSTSHFFASVLQKTGMKVGLYTSPHIVDFTERLRIISGDKCRTASKEWVFEFLSSRMAEFDSEGFSFFEITTMMAFEWFAAEKVDIAVIETGLGGRLDTTNIITPILSVVTSIGLDHMDILGDTLEKIASEKAGIIKPGIPVVAGTNLKGTLPVFEAAAKASDSPLFLAPEDPGISPEIMARMDLGGSYQRMNLATVKTALQVLETAILKLKNLTPEDYADAIVRCAEITSFQGRWQVLRKDPLVIADMGHNAAALEHNFSQLKALAEGKRLTVIYAKAKDKDLAPIVPLMPPDARYIFTQATGPRAMDAEELKNQAAALAEPLSKSHLSSALKAAESEPNPRKALEKALLDSDIIYVGGTSFILSEVL